MLRFLLDEHISPVVCSIVRVRRSQISIESLLEWRGGSLRGKDDHIVLASAAEAGYTLVTYDLRTIPSLLRAWAATGLEHQGVVFIDERTYRPQDLPESPTHSFGFRMICARSSGQTVSPSHPGRRHRANIC